MKRHFLYNTLLNIGLILMIFSAVAAYNSKQYPVLAISVVIVCVLVYLKYRLLKQVRQMTNKR
ncbi:sortase [Parapedobacter sp. ISTM3]|uniref:Uncharacterized protein n=1 Tax=Parapedobacter luteus TaxID=623280 RepID=A0A1T5DAE4_9SPHI|nr:MULTISPECIES: DUF6358 family protein [Parapedobacter]MBK1438500.1 sortase [Parapedobacter sp. ISTM3]SKB68513.1 hypothetical protein SAMN05660226_02645 [Parapedobacter luteus]